MCCSCTCGFGFSHAFPPFCMRISAAQEEAPTKDIFSTKMLPATFVVNDDGRKACFCPLPEDEDGLYVLFFNQGKCHGSKKIKADAAQLGETAMLPILLFTTENFGHSIENTNASPHASTQRRRTTSSSGVPQPAVQTVPTKSGGSCSSPPARPTPTGRTSL